MYKYGIWSYRELAEAVTEGNVQQVKQLARDTGRVKKCFRQGGNSISGPYIAETIMSAAVEAGSPEIVSILLGAGAPVIVKRQNSTIDAFKTAVSIRRLVRTQAFLRFTNGGFARRELGRAVKVKDKEYIKKMIGTDVEINKWFKNISTIEGMLRGKYPDWGEDAYKTAGGK